MVFVANAKKYASEIAKELVADGVNAVILTLREVLVLVAVQRW